MITWLSLLSEFAVVCQISAWTILPKILGVKPQKCNFGPWIGLSSVNDKNSRTYNFNSFIPIMTKFWDGIATMNGPSWVVPWLPWTKQRWWIATILNFIKNNNIVVLNKIFAHNFVRRCYMRQATDNNCKTAFSLQCSRAYQWLNF